MDQDNDVVLVISSGSDDTIDENDGDGGFLLRLYSSFEEHSAIVQHPRQRSKCIPTTNHQGEKQLLSVSTPTIKTKLKLPGSTLYPFRNCVEGGDTAASCGQRSTENDFHRATESSSWDDAEETIDSDFKIDKYTSSESEELFMGTETSSLQLMTDRQLKSTNKNEVCKTKSIAERKKKLAFRKQKNVIWKGSTVSYQENAVKESHKELPPVCLRKEHNIASDMQTKNTTFSQKNGELCKSSLRVCLHKLKLPIHGDKSKYFENVTKSKPDNTAVVPETDSSDDFECVPPSQKKRSPAQLCINLDSSSDGDDFASFSQTTKQNTSLVPSQVKRKSRKTSSVARQSRKTSTAAHQSRKTSQVANQTKITSLFTPKTKYSSSFTPKKSVQVTPKTNNTSRAEKQMRSTQRQNQKETVFCSGAKVRKKNINSGHSNQKGCKRLKLSKYFGFSCSDSDSFVSFSDSDGDGDGKVVYRPKVVQKHKVIKDGLNSFSERSQMQATEYRSEDDTESDSLISPKKQVIECSSVCDKAGSVSKIKTETNKSILDELDNESEGNSDVIIAWDDHGWNNCKMTTDKKQIKASSTLVTSKSCSGEQVLTRANSGTSRCDNKEQTGISEKNDATEAAPCNNDNSSAESPINGAGFDAASPVTAEPDKQRCAENCLEENAQDELTCSYSQIDVGDSDFSGDDEIFASLMQPEFEPKGEKQNDAVNSDDNAYDEWTDDFLREIDASFHEEHVDCDPCLLSDDGDDDDLVAACDEFEKSFHSSGETLQANQHSFLHDVLEKESSNKLFADENCPSSNDKQMSEATHIADELSRSKAWTSLADKEQQTSEHKVSNEEVFSPLNKDEVTSMHQHPMAQGQAISDENVTISSMDNDLQRTVAVKDQQRSACHITGDEDLAVSAEETQSGDAEHHSQLQKVNDQEVLPVASAGEDHRVITAEVKEIQAILDKQQQSDLITPCPEASSSQKLSVSTRKSLNSSAVEQKDRDSLPVCVSPKVEKTVLAKPISDNTQESSIDHCKKCVVKLERCSIDKLMLCSDNAKASVTAETHLARTDNILFLSDVYTTEASVYPEDPVPIKLQSCRQLESGTSSSLKTNASNKAEIKHISVSKKLRLSHGKVTRKDDGIKSPSRLKIRPLSAKRSPIKRHSQTSLSTPIKHKVWHHSDKIKHTKQQQKTILRSPVSLTSAIKHAKAEMLRRQRLLASKNKTETSSSCLKTATTHHQKHHSNKEHVRHSGNVSKSSDSSVSKVKNTRSADKTKIIPNADQTKNTAPTDARNSTPQGATTDSKSTGNVRSETHISDKATVKHRMISVTEPHHIKPKVGKVSKQGNKCSNAEECESHQRAVKSCTKTTADLKTDQKMSTDIFAVLNLKSPSQEKVIKPPESSKSASEAPKRILQQQQPQQQQQQVMVQRSKLIQPASTNQTSWQPSCDSVLVDILKWSPKWFEEYEKIKQMPPVVQKEQLFPLLEIYLTYNDYVRVMTPHFLLETWHTSYSDWKKNLTNSSVIRHDVLPVHLQFQGAQCEGKSESNKFMDLHCKGILSPANARTNNYIQDGDLVTLKVPCIDVQGQPGTKMVLGYVLKSNKVPRKECHLPSILEENLITKPANAMILCTEIRSLYRRICIDNKRFIKLEVISSLVGQLRQYQGLCYLRKSLLGSDILHPSGVARFTGPVVKESHNLQKKFNKQQSHAINMISAGFLLPYETPKLYLLQGPPGTGKSHAVTGLIHRLIVKGMNKRPRVRILVCAPSNNAVDELVRRLKHVDQSLRKAKQGDLRVVRVGKLSSIKQDVIDCSLDEIFDKNWRDYYSNSRQNAMESVKMEAKHLQQKLEYYRKTRDQLQQQGSTAQVRALESEMAKLEKRLNGITGLRNKSQLSATEAYNIKRQILMSAHVVCSTLNGSGGAQLMKYLQKSPGEIPFTSLIIDEAGQCTELDTLIPLQYGVTKVVLVGDPEQLPPTVISKEAADQNYGQSLFERFYGYFKMRPDNPIMMLRTQYRMHPEVCSFPSKHVYMGKLKTDIAVHKALEQNYPFKHYAVFDLEYSQEEQQQEGSIYNLAEAKFINGLCHYILTYHRDFRPDDIGVITPYQKQRTVIQDQLYRDFRGLDVKTVDGFQGQERNIIILSCVRARSASGNIGFLADRRRMNVALTRAKYACYVVGNVKLLQTNTDWRSLVKDAEERNVLLHVRTEADMNKAFSWLHK